MGLVIGKKKAKKVLEPTYRRKETRPSHDAMMRLLGCRIFALPVHPRRLGSIVPDNRKEIFLGFGQTVKRRRGGGRRRR